MIVKSPPTYHSDYSIDPLSAEAPNAASTVRNKRGVAGKFNLWPQHGTLTIAFMNTPEHEKEFIKKSIEDTYGPLINLQLKFVEGSKGDVRISTGKEEKGTWSYFGTEALKVPPNEPTMHIDYPPDTGDLSANILHEFGHALGLLHEHQHPDRTLEFNIRETYKHFENEYKWRVPHTYHNIFKKADPADVITSPYDQQSIMHYDMSDTILWKQPSTGANYVLSENDKAFLQTLYPHYKGRPRNRPQRPR